MVAPLHRNEQKLSDRALRARGHLREAGTGTDGVRAANRSIVERLDDLEARRFGVSLDGRALAFVAVLVRANVRAA